MSHAEKNRFMQQPKLHLIMHVFLTLQWEADLFDYAYNPINETVPMCEDFIGKISRTTRRVSQRLMSKRTIDTYSVQVAERWRLEYAYDS